MHYNYILQSQKDKSLYTGCTNNIARRLAEHNKGFVKSTENKKPYKLIYCEICVNQDDAYRREKYLKSGPGKKFIKSRIKNYFESDSVAPKVFGTFGVK